MITDASVEAGRLVHQSADYHAVVHPIFTLEGQEGRRFGPLAFTKTYAMAGAALLAIVVIPIPDGLLDRGKFRQTTTRQLLFDSCLSSLLLEYCTGRKPRCWWQRFPVLTVLGRSIKWAGGFYRRLMKATCCICHRRCRGFPQRRRRDAAKTDKLIMSVPKAARVLAKPAKWNRHRSAPLGDGRNDYPA
ncbi:hypothetical protein ACNKHN_02640 [Shigella flexneri]